MIKGQIIKLLGGFYYVKSSNSIYECRARGLFRKDNIKPLVGDYVNVQIDSLDEKKGYILDVLDRKNTMIRPEVANIEQLILVFSLKAPNINFFLLDSMLLHCSIRNIKPIICFNKKDLDIDNSITDKVKSIYCDIGYEIVFTNLFDENSMQNIKSKLYDKVSAFSGPSGVGKSSLISKMLGIEIKSGEISKKIERGKHTTRHSELIEFNFDEGSGLVLDTPGFSSPQDIKIEPREISAHMPEFEEASNFCKFRDCMHLNEPKCEVLKKLKNEEISKSRYQSYLIFIEESKKFEGRNR